MNLKILTGKIVTAKFRNLNTISVLAQHIHYYISRIRPVFLGGSLEKCF